MLSDRKVITISHRWFFRFIDQDTNTYSSSSAPLKLKAQPKGVAHENDLTAVATLESVHLIKNGSTVQEEKVDYEPSCVSISSDLQSLAVGDAGQGMVFDNDKKILAPLRNNFRWYIGLHD